MGEFVRLDVQDTVGIVRLDRPPANAINEQLLAELRTVAHEATERDDIGAVVIWGGPKIFAAGADVNMMADRGTVDVKGMITEMQNVFTMVEEIPKVTIAAVTGYALGGGCELALCADFRFASETARLGQPEIQLGIIPGAGGTQRLPRLIGTARAKDLIYSGRHVAAEEAKAIGLVDAVHSVDDVFPMAVEAARKFASGPRVALRAAKVAINWGTRGDLPAGLVLEREVFVDLFSTEDQKTGMRSFVERGPGKATFAGR